MCEKMATDNRRKSRQNDFFDICSKCLDGCCNGARPPLTKQRKEIICRFLETKGLKIAYPFVDTGYSFPRETSEGYCIFWNKNSRKCQVQPVKPETCVAGPITFDINRRTGKVEWWLKKETICPLAGALYRRKGDLNAHVRTARIEILRLIRDLDLSALLAILEIEEPETFKIDEDILDSKFSVTLNDRRRIDLLLSCTHFPISLKIHEAHYWDETESTGRKDPKS
jgi:Fe-S-cluster containining protein